MIFETYNLNGGLNETFGKYFRTFALSHFRTFAVMILLLTCVIAYPQTYNIYTPRGSAVSVNPNFMPGDTAYLGTSARALFSRYFNPSTSIDISEDINFGYNCFGYAFTAGNAYIDEADAAKFFDEYYVGDGSYSKVDYFSDASYVLYTTGNYIDHIAVPQETLTQGGESTTRAGNVISKWFYSNLVWHPYNADNPYTGSAISFHGPAHDVPKNHSTLDSALSNSKPGQVVKIYGACPALTTEHIMTHDIIIMPGGSIDINGYPINRSSGKKLTIQSGGTISSSVYCLVSNTSEGIVGVYPTLSNALQAWQSGETITVYGSHSVSSISVPSGYSLVISSGASITISGNMTVNGSLSVSGATLNFSGGGSLSIYGSANCSSSTFTGSGWNGISIDFANATFTNCNISNANYAMSIYNCDVPLTGCRFINNTRGINFSYSSGSVSSTVFNNHNDAIVGDASSLPDLYPNNSFRAVTHFHVLSYANEQIQAILNHWDGKEVSQNVNTDGELADDPNPARLNTPEAPVDAPLFKTSYIAKNSETKNGITLFNQAKKLFDEKYYDSAYVCFKSIADTYGDSLVGRNSILFMENILNKKEKSADITGMLDIYSNKKSGIAPFAEYRKSYSFLRSKNYQKAINMIKSVKFASDDIEMEKVRLFDLGIITYDCLEDKTGGLKYLNELVKKYPEDRLNKMASVFYGLNKSEKDNNKSISGDNNETMLFANYPNPFNPSTVIKYNVSSDEHVTLKVFDIMGREVSTLVNEYKQKGAYDVKFNGAGLSSGIYFYQLKAGNVNQIQKMILTK